MSTTCCSNTGMRICTNSGQKSSKGFTVRDSTKQYLMATIYHKINVCQLWSYSLTKIQSLIPLGCMTSLLLIRQEVTFCSSKPNFQSRYLRSWDTLAVFPWKLQWEVPWGRGCDPPVDWVILATLGKIPIKHS